MIFQDPKPHAIQYFTLESKFANRAAFIILFPLEITLAFRYSQKKLEKERVLQAMQEMQSFPNGSNAIYPHQFRVECNNAL
jgi:hypothetical protein